jgi:hypothetical protein
LNATPDLFSGEDRLELWPLIGRVMRMGDPSALRVSNIQRVNDAVRSGDWATAKAFVDYMHPGDLLMISLIGEWSWRWPQAVARKFGLESAETANARALKIWRETFKNASGREHEDARTAVDVFQELAAASALKEAAPPPALTQALLATPVALHGKLAQSFAAEDKPGSLALFDEYIRSARDRHDFISRYLWAYPTAVARAHGDAASEELLMQSFRDCSFQEQMWGLFKALKPIERTAFMADHMRSHFSGEGRAGVVDVIEEDERYRIVFDACGSGGAMRRDGAAEGWSRDLRIYEKASPLTWSFENAVPAYCSHCAVNDITGIEKAGYPLWITEFNPDRTQPCGWTIYKDPKKIPAHYFTRVGKEKPKELCE